MNEHTPGPLEGGTWQNRHYNFEGEVIGDLWEVTTPTGGCQDFNTVGYAFSKEDSVLFAAAPELLEALQAAVQELYDHVGEEPRSGRYAHLDRVIAKATGEQ